MASVRHGSISSYVAPQVKPPETPDFHPLQVLRRTDGQLIVYDERRPLGKRTRQIFGRGELKKAIETCANLYKLEVLRVPG